MKKLRTFYDIFSIIVVLVVIAAVILQSTLSVEALIDNVRIIYLVLGIVGGLYTLSIIILAAFLSTHGKEVPALVIIIVACLILPGIVAFLLYLFVMRKIMKSPR